MKTKTKTKARSVAAKARPAIKTVKKNIVKAFTGNRSEKDSEVEVGNGLRKLFVDQLKDMYWAEKVLVNALTKMSGKSTSEDLAEAIENHLEETNEQVKRLEKAFSELNLKAEGKKCEAIAGLIKEADQMVADAEDSATKDAAIILALQKVEHYEIATYGTLCTFAKLLNEDRVLSLLKETLGEEKNADETLSELAESEINLEAVGAGEMD